MTPTDKNQLTETHNCFIEAKKYKFTARGLKSPMYEGIKNLRVRNSGTKIELLFSGRTTNITLNMRFLYLNSGSRIELLFSGRSSNITIDMRFLTLNSALEIDSQRSKIRLPDSVIRITEVHT